VLGIKHL